MIQSGHPVYLPNLDTTEPIRLDLLRAADDKLRQHDEAFLRDLIHRAPSVLPIGEIEPMFEFARAICIELPNPAGFVDNLLVTSEGGIVLVECKLQRNLQARREVIAQIMDYAAQLQAWTFEDLDRAVRKAMLLGKGTPRGLMEAFDDREDFDPLAFQDAITRNLRRGRMLLLIVGDGIREGLESLVGILQRHPGFHAALGLIELKLYNLPEGGFIVQPRTLLRTLNIERGVVSFSDDRLAIVQPEAPANSCAPDMPSAKRPTSLTEEEFYSLLGQDEGRAEWPGLVKGLVRRLEDIGVTPEFKRSLILRWAGADGRMHNVINIRKFGRVFLEGLSWQMQSEAEFKLVTAFRERIAQLCGGEVRGGRNDQNIYIADRFMTVAALSGREEAFAEMVHWLIRELQD
ncbi:MAG: hypothetical protein ABL974_16460, partial [Prosthecobacter sp.]